MGQDESSLSYPVNVIHEAHYRQTHPKPQHGVTFVIRSGQMCVKKGRIGRKAIVIVKNKNGVEQTYQTYRSGFCTIPDF